MTHGGKKRRLCLVSFFSFCTGLPVFRYHRMQLGGASFNLCGQMFAMVIEGVNATAKGIHQPPDGIQLANACGFRKGGVNIPLK